MNYAPTTIKWLDALLQSLPDHAEYFGDDLRDCMTDSSFNGDAVIKSLIALTAALSSGNGEMAFAIEMDDSLIGNPDRDKAKQVVWIDSVNHIRNSYSGRLPLLEYSKDRTINILNLVPLIVSGTLPRYNDVLDLPDTHALVRLVSLMASVGKIAL